MDGDAYLCEEVRMWKCKKHPLRRRHGVCPKCLRDRLLLLCPDCAQARPCGCLQSSSSAFSSFSSFSSFDPPRSSVGTVGRVGNLIDDEPAFLRSRSAAFRFLRPRSDSTEWPRGGRGWASFWPFSKDAARSEEEVAVPKKLLRSRTVGAGSSSGTGGGGSGSSKGRGWHWRFPNPFNAFRHRKSAKVVQERSPFRRGRSANASS